MDTFDRNNLEGVPLIFPKISSGYIGKFDGSACVQSQLISILVNGTYAEVAKFPQRLPRLGFFQELSQFETPEFQNEFASKIEYLKKKLLSRSIDSDELIRLAEVWIRLGQILPKSSCTNSAYLGYLYHLQKINMDLSDGIPISIKKLNQLITYSNGIVSQNKKLSAILQAFVAANRYATDSSTEEISRSLFMELSSGLQQLSDDTFEDVCLASMIHRGLPMASWLAVEERKWHLKESEKLALNLHFLAKKDGKYLKLLAIENECTLRQTLYKFYLFDGQLEVAELQLRKALKMDPTDAALKQELGLFYYDQKQFTKATAYFEEIIESGPPGLAMNRFFLACSYNELGKTQQAIDLLEQALKFDPLSTTLYIELIRLYSEKGLKEQVQRISKQFFDNGLTKKDLDEEEKSYLELAH